MAEGAPGIVRPEHRGDGTLFFRDLNDYLAGQIITRVEPCRATREGYTVTVLHFADGAQLGIIPRPVVRADSRADGLTLMTEFVFCAPQAPTLIRLPGERHRW